LRACRITPTSWCDARGELVIEDEARYLRDLGRIEEVVNDDLTAGDTGAAKAIWALVGTVTVIPTPAGTPPGVIVRGRLRSLLRLDPFPTSSQFGGRVVPGERIELPTNGLQNRCSTAELTRRRACRVVNVNGTFTQRIPGRTKGPK
jgi:hypothetical protein